VATVKAPAATTAISRMASLRKGSLLRDGETADDRAP